MIRRIHVRMRLKADENQWGGGGRRLRLHDRNLTAIAIRKRVCLANGQKQVWRARLWKRMPL